MSMYGPPGGPYPGQPQDPWQGGQPPQDPYGQPQDPYGQGQQQDPYGQPQQQPWGQDQWGGSPSSAPPGSAPPYGQPSGYPQTAAYQPGGYPQQPGYPPQQPGFPPQQPGYGPPPAGEQWGAPVAPAKKGGSGVLITVVVVLAVLLCGGGAAGAYFVFSGDNTNNVADTDPTPGTSGSASGSASTGSSAKASASASASSENLTVVRALKAGDCFNNQGTDDNPKIVKVACAPGAFSVIKRIDGTSDKNRCAGTKDYTHDYFYKTSSEATSFVLCLKIVS